MKRSYLLAELAQLLGAELRGNAEQEICALATLQSASSTDLSFIANPAYKKYLSATNAGALLINAELADDFVGNKLVVNNPYLAYARLSAIFEFLRAPHFGIHPTAVIGTASRPITRRKGSPKKSPLEQMRLLAMASPWLTV